MKYYLHIFLVATLCAVAASQTPATKLGFRELDTSCSSFGSSDWDGCNKQASCAFQKGTCSSYDSSRLSQLFFDQNTEYKYCDNMPQEGYLYLKNFRDRTLTIKGLGKAGSHDLCEWRIMSSTDSKVTMTIERSSSIYEDIRIEVSFKDSTKVYNLRDLQDWGSSTKQLVFDSAYLIKLKVQIMDNNSDYSIKLKQDPEEKFTEDWLIILLCSIAITFTLLLWGVLIYCCYRKIKQDMKDRNVSEAVKEKIMKNMQSGNFSSLTVNYNQENCVICLENFEAESKIHIINECSHVFHTDCLKEYFDNIKKKNKVQCPHCCVEITTKSKQRTKIHASNDSSANFHNQIEQIEPEADIEREIALEEPQTAAPFTHS